ncbi:MAG: hypothetical protein FVQ77_13290 [Cytophagales bacterium]|nr:hypothetical protein [Cytophagales bacterium]
MKRLLLIAFFITIVSRFCFSQCNFDDDQLLQCTALLEDYSFIKVYEIDVKFLGSWGGNATTEYSYVFSENTYYKLQICETKVASDLVISIYDMDNNLITTNDNNPEHLRSAIGFLCNSSGVYRLRFIYKSDEIPMDCGYCVLGTKKI